MELRDIITIHVGSVFSDTAVTFDHSLSLTGLLHVEQYSFHIRESSRDTPEYRLAYAVHRSSLLLYGADI
eukprot:COSAG01_NODE_23068_length_829_cov_25.610959_2_plen_70_part_00